MNLMNNQIKPISSPSKETLAGAKEPNLEDSKSSVNMSTIDTYREGSLGADGQQRVSTATDGSQLKHGTGNGTVSTNQTGTSSKTTKNQSSQENQSSSHQPGRNLADEILLKLPSGGLTNSNSTKVIHLGMVTKSIEMLPGSNPMEITQVKAFDHGE